MFYLVNNSEIPNQLFISFFIQRQNKPENNISTSSENLSVAAHS